MSDWPIGMVDLVVIGVILISGLLALAHGLVREVLSIFAWIGAAAAALYGFKYAQPIARTYIGGELLADAAAGAGLFIVSLIVLSALSHSVSGAIREGRLNAVDRSLGFVFGLIRGAILVCLAYIVWTWAMPAKDQPAWLTSARTLPLIEIGADFLRKLAPPELLPRTQAAARDIGGKAAEAQRMLNTLSTPLPKAAATDDRPGYNAGERKDLDRLIQGNR